VTETNGLDEFKSQLETIHGDLDQLTNDAKSEVWRGAARGA
jgi:hypothetical protein